jgi:hypothetical protein
MLAVMAGCCNTKQAGSHGVFEHYLSDRIQYAQGNRQRYQALQDTRAADHG